MRYLDFQQDKTILKNTSVPQSPTVSILMPTYYRGDTFLSRAIESVLSQTFKDFELIIIDDGSRDSTFDVLKSYQQKDSRIIIIRHEFNSGLPALRMNEGLLMARGKYISYQFDDDEYVPSAIETLYNRIIQEPDPCVVYGSCELTILRENGAKQTRILGEREFNYGLLNNENYIANNSVMHHKSIIDLVGLYDCNIAIRRFSDYDLWLRMAKKVPFYWINTIVSKVLAGSKHALGSDVPITNLSLLRRYIEINRTTKLLPTHIADYEIDGLSQFNEHFSLTEIDYINRQEVIPFLSKTTYIMNDTQKQTYNISRPYMKRVMVAKSDYSTSVDVTLKNYLTQIKNFPYKYYFYKEGWLGTLTPADFDLAILYRTITIYATKFLENNKLFKKPTAYFMDDNMFKFHELGDTFRYLAPSSPGYANLEIQVQNADLVASYNPVITEDCKKYTHKIHQLKTNIPLAYLTPKPIHSTISTSIRIGIFSGPVRNPEISFLWPILEKLAHVYKNKLTLEFWGIDPSNFGTLECSVVYKPFTHSYEAYLDALKATSFDFHICPLMGIKDATKSKSPIKFLEGTVCGSIGIFSDVIPYDQIPNDLCLKSQNTLTDWYDTLEKAILMPETTRYNMYLKALDYITKNYSSEYQAFDLLATLEATQLQNHLGNQKIAYMFHESYLGGATLHLFRHALMAQSMGIEIILCLGENQRAVDQLPNLVAPYGFTIHYLPYKIFATPTNFGPEHQKDAETIKSWLQTNNVGMIHGATFNPTVGLAAQLARIPNIASLHQYYPDPSNTFDKTRFNIQAVHSSSNRYAELWKKALAVPTQRIVCPVEKTFFDFYPTNYADAQTLFTSNKTIRILVSGTLQDRKNQLEAIKAVKLLRDLGYNIELDLVGYDTLRPAYRTLCENEILTHNLTNFVHIHGFSTTPEIYYNNHCHILLCCSTDESMPQTILQAMAAGLFVISTPVGGVNEIIKDNYNGLITNGPSGTEIAQTIKHLLDFTPKYRDYLLSNAYDTIQTMGSYHFVKSELLFLYNKGFNELD